MARLANALQPGHLAAPGLALLGASVVWALRRSPAAVLPLIAGPLAFASAFTVGAFTACGGWEALLGRGGPLLQPLFTGQASFLLAVTAALGPTLAMATVVGLACARRWPVAPPARWSIR